MYIKDIMTANPVCVEENLTVTKAIQIMEDGKFHRLPIVRNGRLAGMVTRGVIAENTPTKATSLSIYELNYLLSKMTVGKIMLKNVVTCKPDDILEDAASKMRANEIGCLPVVNDNNEVVGIITDTDVFTALVDLLGYNEGGYRYIISIEDDRVGVLKDISEYFFEADINILNLSVEHKKDGSVDVVIIGRGEKAEELGKQLSEKYTVKYGKNEH